MAFLPYLHRVAEGGTLARAEAYEAMSAILEGNATTAQIAGLMVAIKMRGEVAEEIVGFAQAMRARMVVVSGLDGLPLIDTCGTGGDGVGTFNISTIVALVLAGAACMSRNMGTVQRPEPLDPPTCWKPWARSSTRRRNKQRRHPAQWHRIFIRAGAPSGDDACAGRAHRIEDADGVQFAGSAVESRADAAAIDRCAV